jgi:RNA polymerase sigma-70 factor (ECF subfamily)
MNPRSYQAARAGEVKSRAACDVFHLSRPRSPSAYSLPATSLFREISLHNGIKCHPWRLSTVSSPIQGNSADVLDPQAQVRFEQLVLPHLDAAFNLARWILRSRADAEDVAQDAILRAYRFFLSFHGGDARAWLLQIVRNTCYSWLEKNRPVEQMTEFNEELHTTASVSPESLAIASSNRDRLTRALESLPSRQREMLVLRELEGCSYKEISTITSIPIGTVMSTLSRARRQLQLALTAPAREEAAHGL